jgi:hypothetical protein
MYEGSHNVSRWSQFDQNFTARAGWRISISLVDADDQYPTYCTGGATVLSWDSVSALPGYHECLGRAFLVVPQLRSLDWPA